MSGKQLETCSERLPEPQRTEFLAAFERADDLVREVTAIRLAAWAVYRETLGLPPKEKTI